MLDLVVGAVRPVDPGEVEHRVDPAERVVQRRRVGQLVPAEQDGFDVVQGTKPAGGVPAEEAESLR